MEVMALFFFLYHTSAIFFIIRKPKYVPRREKENALRVDGLGSACISRIL
jgi:hypothetical protein